MPGDQVVYRNGSQLARADLRTVARVERAGDDVLVTFAHGSAQTHYASSTRVIVLPKVQRTGWWENR